METRLDKGEIRKIRKKLAQRLGVIQREAKDLGIPAMIVIEGIDGSGKGTLLNRLILELDARAYDIFSTHAGDHLLHEYPLLWTVSQHTPATGKLQFFDRSAYYLVLDAWAEGKLKEKDLTAYWEDINHFERQLADNETLILKIFLTTSKNEQAKRFQKFAGNPNTAWRVTDKDWRRHRQYSAHLAQVRKMMSQTHHSFAPWKEIVTDDLDAATIELYETVIAAFEEKVNAFKVAQTVPEPPRTWVPYRGVDHLANVDLSKSISRGRYKKRLKQKQAEVYDLAHQLHALKIPVVMVYCGWDAAGKGGCIKRLLQGVDPRSFSVVPIGAPTAEELSHHYLWRFWKELPRRGKITIFDRSWYGRVLVERVEALCSNLEWKRAYQEINEMEAHLIRFGTVVIKFWLQIDPETQLERFEARQADPNKRWKITAEDWRNREKHELYEQAVNEMITETSTAHAPWTLISATCKQYARIQTLDTAIAAMKAAIKRKHLAEL